MTRDDYPGAPDGSYVSEEGWLIVGDEAWTPQEWATTLYHPKRSYSRHASDAERRAAHRRAKRGHMRRKRETAA